MLMMLFFHIAIVSGWGEFDKVNVSICDASHRSGKFYIKEPRTCSEIALDRIETCSTQVFAPLLQPSVCISAVRCFLLTERYSTISYFFGSKSKETFPALMLPINGERCRRVSTSRRDIKLGKLILVGKSTYQTTNKLDIKYHWPVAHSGSVTNIAFQILSLDYHFLTGHLSSRIDDLSSCRVQDLLYMN